MAANNEKFLQMIHEAESITDTIRKLKLEMESYETAGKSLSEVKQSLERYIGATHEASAKLAELTQKIAQFMDETENTVVMIKENTDNLTGKLESVKAGLNDQGKALSGIRTLVMAAIAVSLIAVVVQFLL